MSDDEKSSSSGTGLTFPQIAGSALAAATAAIMGSFLGVFGTIGGAAVASIVSTVGSALYQRSLEKTRDTVKDRLVVGGPAQQKVAGAVARVTGAQPSAGARPGAPQVPPNQQTQQARQATQQAAPPVPRPGVVGPGRGPGGTGGRAPAPGPGHRPGVPPRTAVPGPPGRPVGPPGPGDRPVRGGGRTVNTQVFGQDPMTRVEGAPRIPNARVPGTPPGGVGPTARFEQGPGGPGAPDAPTQLTPAEPSPGGARRRLLGKKGWTAVAGLAASIFAIALLASFGVETAAGHPLSGGSSGTSVGSLFGQNTGTPRPTTSDTPTSTTTSSSDGSSSDDQRPGSDRSRSDTPTTTRSSSQSGNGNDQQDRSSRQNLLPTQLVPQLGGGSSSNG